MGSVLVDPIGISACKNGSEILVAGGPSRRCVAQKGEIRLRVISDGVNIVIPSLQPAIATAVVVLDPGSLIRVIRAGVDASLVVRGERIRGLHKPIAVDIREPRLLAIGSRKPAEEMIEGAIFHHHHDNVVKA